MTPQHLEVIETKTIRPFKYPRLALNGYLYHFHKKCTHHLRWKCNRVYSLKCPAVLRTNIDKYELEHIAVDHEHVHGPDFIAIEALKARINIHKQSSLFNKNTCFKQKNLDAFFEEIDLPEIIKNSPVRFCASSKEIFFTDPLDPDYKNGNTEKYEELIKNNLINFENYPFNKLEQKDDKNQIGINLKDDIMKNHTSYSFNEDLKNVNQICQATSPNEHNMTINNQKNNAQQNKRALLTNTHEKKNTSTTNTYKKISHFTTNARKVKNSLINNIKKKIYTLTNNKYSLRNYKNKRNYILSKNNQIEKNMLISNKHTLKRSLITNTNKRKHFKTTNKQKNKSTLITNPCRQIIPSKVKLRKYTSKCINQNSPIIINTTITTSTSTIKSTPTIISTPKIENATEIISTPKVTSTSTVNSLPSIKTTHNMMERCLNKNINNANESISDSDDDFNFGFDTANYNAIIDDNDEETNIKIKKYKLVQEDYMYHILYSKKNWKTILKKLSDPLTGIKVFENILLIKVLIRIMKGNNRTKRQVNVLKSRNDHWKLKFDCLEHKIKTLVNSTRSDRNIRRTSVLNKKAKDTTLCTNIEVHKQKYNFGLKKKVSTELKSNVTLENLKTSKLYQYFNSQNNFLSKCGSDIMTSKSEEIKTNISSTPVMVDLIKDIPENVIISRLSPKPKFDTKQNNLTQSDSDIKMIQSKFIQSNENFSPVSCISKALNLSSKSLKRKISNLIQNNTSIEIKSKFRKYNRLSSLASNDLIMESLPDIMVSRFGPKLLNRQTTNSTQHNTAYINNMTESNINKYYESFTPASIDVILNNLPIIINSRLIGEKNIFTQFNKHTEIIPSISKSNDLNSDVPTFSSSSMRAVTSLNDNLLFNKQINPALSMVAPSNVEVLVFEENLEISSKDSKMINYKEWKSPRKLTVRSETDPSVGTTVILPFALKRLSKLNNHSPSQYPMLNKLLTKPNNIILKLDKRDKLNTPLIPVQMKTPLPDVVYESTQIMNKINFKETIQTNHSYDHQKSPNQIKSVPKAIPLPSPEIINDFSKEI